MNDTGVVNAGTIEPEKSLTVHRKGEEGISNSRERGRQQGVILALNFGHEKDKGSVKVFGPSRKSHPHQDSSGIWLLVTKEFDL